MNISDFLTVVAIIIAFFSIATTITIFRLNLNMWLLYAFISSFVFSWGFLAVQPFLSTKLPDENFLYLHYNQISSVLIDLTILLMVTIFFKAIVRVSNYKERKAVLFLKLSHSFILSADENKIGYFLNEVAWNIDKVLILGKRRIHPDYNYFSQKEKEAIDASLGLLNLLEDDFVCKAIATRFPHVFYKLIVFIILNKAWQESKLIANSLVSKILVTFVENTNSIFHREQENDRGLSIIDGGLKKFIFSNLDFVQSKYQPLHLFPLSFKNDLSTQAIKIYFNIFNISLDQYLTENSAIGQNIEKQNEPTFYAFFSVVEGILHNKKNSLDFEKITIQCISGLLSILEILEEIFNFEGASTINIEEELKASDYSYNKDRTICGALANGIYRVISALAQARSTFDNIRHFLIRLYTPLTDNNYLIVELKKRLFILVSQSIDRNFSDLSYPAMTAVIINAFGLWDPVKNEIKTDIHEYALNKLKTSFHELYKKDPIIAYDMLPDEAEYLSETRTICWIKQIGKGESRRMKSELIVNN